MLTLTCISCARPHDLSGRLTGDVILCACGAQLLVRHGNGASQITCLNAPADEAPELLPRRASGLYLTAQELYALACRSFDFWYQRSPSGACWQVLHNGQVIAEVSSAARARTVIVERFKELLKGGA